jgi:hypothetical protein
MKQCPTCNRTYPDDSLRFCLEDGSPLSLTNDPDATLVMSQSGTQTRQPAAVAASAPPPAARSNQKFLYLAIALGAVLLGGGAVALLKSSGIGANTRQTTLPSNPTAKPTNTATPLSREWTVTIPAVSPWTCTNIDITEGQTLTITATGRGVWKNVAQSYPKGFEECGPDGTPPVDSADYYSNISSYQCPEAYKGALIGRIGQNGTPFPVGAKFRRVMTESGALCLGINDLKPQVDATGFRDNSGAFTAHIRLGD